MAWSASTVKTEQIKTLTTFESAVLARLRQVVAVKAKELSTRAQSKVKGRLATKIYVKEIDNRFGIKGVIASKWYVGRFFELGYGGKTIEVKAHTRRVRSQDVRAKVQNAKGQLRSKIVKKGEGRISAHSRRIPRIHRPYLSKALEEMRQDIRSALNSAIKEASLASRS